MYSVASERLLLRQPLGSDAAAMMEIHQDPAVLPHVTVTAPTGGVTVAWRNIAMMLGHWQMRGYGQWTVVERATNETRWAPPTSWVAHVRRAGHFSANG